MHMLTEVLMLVASACMATSTVAVAMTYQALLNFLYILYNHDSLHVPLSLFGGLATMDV